MGSAKRFSVYLENCDRRADTRHGMIDLPLVICRAGVLWATLVLYVVVFERVHTSLDVCCCPLQSGCSMVYIPPNTLSNHQTPHGAMVSVSEFCLPWGGRFGNNGPGFDPHLRRGDLTSYPRKGWQLARDYLHLTSAGRREPFCFLTRRDYFEFLSSCSLTRIHCLRPGA